MIQSLRHRGPDGTGFAAVPLPGSGCHFLLGHARLSILDPTEHAYQPMCHAATNSWLVYNGEIYNFRELRRVLEGRGIAFISTGDTEVLLETLVCWGEEALQRLKGMYAFGFWDGVQKRLILARDPLGIKPLYYSRLGDSLVFSSEVRAFGASGLGARSLNLKAVSSFLKYGAVIGPETILREVQELPPGHLLEARTHREVKAPTKFWSLGEHLLLRPDPSPVPSFPEAVRSVQTLLEQSIRSHLVSDVPTGLFLSGGIDSSLLASLTVRAVEDRTFHLLTVGFPEQDFSEIEDARRVAERVPGKHQVIVLTAEDLLKGLPSAISAMDQPTVDGINTYVISWVAASLGIKVLLSGLGGDEIFGGYTTFRKVPILSRYRGLLTPLSKAMLKIRSGNVAQWHKVARTGLIEGLREAYLLHRSLRWPGAAGCLFMDATVSTNSGFPHEAWGAVDRAGHLEDFHKVAFLELTFYMQNQLLRDADVFSSANSVELRVPFLDLDVVRRALNLPARFHGNLLTGKKITRSILRRLHSDLRFNRRKKGFVLPWTYWLRGPLYELIGDTLHNERLYESLGLDHREGEQALRLFEAQDPLVSWLQIWSLFVLLNWQERHQLAA